jgi:hypothetical protein
MRYGSFASLLFGLALTSCETEFDIAVINNLDEQVSVAIGDHTEDAPAGKLLKYHYPSVDGIEKGEMRITTSQCTLTYNLPHDLDDYPWRTELNGVLPVQLERDFKLYEIPPNSMGVVPLSNVTSLQRGGFPVSPSKRECH